MGDSVRQAIEPRRDLAVPLPVEIVRRGGVASTEYAVNLSPGGLCLHLPRPLEVGESVALSFVLPGGGPGIEARGRVIWSDPPAQGARVRFCETGIRFEGLAEGERRRLLDFVQAGESSG